MSSSTSLIIAQILPTNSSKKPSTRQHHATPTALPLPTRRQCLLLLTATTAFKAMEMPSSARDIPLFGLRQGLRKVEQEAEVIVKEGIEAADKGIVAAEKGVEAAEKGLEAAEKGVEEAVSFSGLAQAGAVAGVELVGVVVASSVVNGILGPEAQKS